MHNFFTTSQENWTNPSGQLHAYLLPGINFAKLVSPYLKVISDSNICAAQPDNSFHATIQRLPFFADDEETCKKLPVYGQALRKYFSNWPAPEISFDFPEVTEDSVLCFARQNSSWVEFVAGVRGCAIDVFGEGAAHFDGVPRAHLTLGYGIKDVPGDDLIDKISEKNDEEKKHRSDRSPFYTMRLDHIAMVAVHQLPSKGIYLFSSIAEFYLK